MIPWTLNLTGPYLEGAGGYCPQEPTKNVFFMQIWGKNIKKWYFVPREASAPTPHPHPHPPHAPSSPIHFAVHGGGRVFDLL
jgi:hypothetical protein